MNKGRAKAAVSGPEKLVFAGKFVKVIFLDPRTDKRHGVIYLSIA